jgi:lipopolysaccharide assembly outer membrane protein LptD (OstA)
MKFSGLTLFALALVLAAGGTVSSQPNRGIDHFSGFDHIQAADIQMNMGTGDFKIPSRFTAVRSGTDITADIGAGNSKKKILHAIGHVLVHQNKQFGTGADATKVTQEPSTLTCDKLDADGTRKFYVATGSVHFTQTNRDMTSNGGTLDDVNHVLHLEGDVHVRDKDQYVDADVLDYNTQTGELNLHGTPATMRLPAESPAPAGYDHIQATTINWNMTGGDFEIPTRFTAVRSGTEISADEGDGNSRGKILHATGHVVVHQEKQFGTGNDVAKVTQEASTLTCDKLDADGSRKYYVATGNVHFTQVNRDMTAKSGTLDDANHLLHLEGDVHIRDKSNYIDADTVDYNTQTGNVDMHGAPAKIRLPVESPAPAAPKTQATKKPKKGR